MSNYVKATNFTAKDSLLTGNPSKIIKGAEIDDEFNAISTAIATKPDSNSPAFTGIPVAPTAAAGTNTTQLATTAFTTAATTAALATLGTMSTQNKTAVDITGGTITGLSAALPVASGGTGSTTATGTGVTVLATSPTLVTPALGTPSALVGTNITGTSNGLNAGIGVNQTWTDVSASRAYGTTYTNSTGKPILVCVQGAITSSGGYISVALTVNGLAVSGNGGNSITPSSNFTAQAIVPNGSTYSGSAGSNGSVTLNWFELR